MKEEIKKLTNLKKLVRPEKAKILKRVQDDMIVQNDMFVQGDMLIKNDEVGKIARHENSVMLNLFQYLRIFVSCKLKNDKNKTLKRIQGDMVVQGDMEVYGHCERMRSNPANYFARSADKNFSPLTFHFSPKDTLTFHFSQRSAFTSHFSRKSGATHVALQHNKRKLAFTLSEVLITLGIIGVVAAMTMPSLIQNYRKQVLVTRAKWFYSFMSNAIQRSEIDNGPACDWVGNDSEDNVEYFNKYIKNYIKYTDIKSCSIATNDDETASEMNSCIFLANGSMFWIRVVDSGAAADFGFFANKPNVYTSDNYLLFMIRNGKFTTYSQGWDGTRSHLFNASTFGCKEGTHLNYCAKLIEYDGWTISDDYPWGVKSLDHNLN